MLYRPDQMLRAMAALTLLLVIELILFAATLHGTPRDCSGEAMQLWNAFANDANQYTQTYEANAARRAKARAKLQREWEALLVCECF